METDVDEEVMAVEDVEGKDQRMLHVPEERQDKDVECEYYSGDAQEDQQEAQLCMGRRWQCDKGLSYRCSIGRALQ